MPQQNKENWKDKFRNHISSYEQDDNFNLLSACRAKYGSVALEDFLDSIQDFISSLLQQQKEEIIEKIEKYKIETQSNAKFMNLKDIINLIK